MSFIPNTAADRDRMLAAIGVEKVGDLFRDVPQEHRFPRLELLPAVSEQEILKELDGLARRNADCGHTPCFLGAGAYHHFIPSVVDFVVSRSEFYTAYTPYQPEISQGTLQAIFEYQSMIARLTGMEVSNASHYDGATSTAEAVIMALNVGQHQRKRVVLSPGVHPQYREVVRTYTQGMGLQVTGDEKADAGPDQTAGLCDSSTACVVVQSPDFFGRIISPSALEGLAKKVHVCGALLVVVVNPISLGLLIPPGELGADVVVGEGQALGNAMAFGGPSLGFFAFRKDHIRRSSGRIAGESTDHAGARGYVFTLSTREQHIRRDKATSNICTNQSLNALAAAAYLTSLGPRGLRRVAELCWHKAHYAAAGVARLPGYSVERGEFFHEFVVRCPVPVGELNRRLYDTHGIIGGFDLVTQYPERKNSMLVCCTEMNSRDEIDLLVSALKEAGNG
ncbi:MAG TPA: aminomethyl-transferring glycine dehydrogenase subunit GcvPA [Spirochaetia bacterium]|nr:aminomethyl-transferring glycine dehydrogenase subunit GcvPA [Spirochaetia bacterium]